MSEERQQPDGADEERQRWPGWEERDPDAGGPRKHGIRRFLPGWRLVLGSFLALVVLVCGGFLVGYLLVDIPAANAAATQQSNVYLYADGTQLASDGDVNRENISLSDLPKPVRHAVLAAEDRDFYTGSAVDPQAMIRGAWKTVTGKGKQSGSTITQQYVKNYYLDQDQTVTRKAKEFFIAIKLDRETSKDEILEGYLNTSYFGRNAYGIQAAAQAYYGIDARDLNTAQGAYLASLLNAPSAYDVIAQPANRSRAEARWNYVLDGMVKENWLTESGRARLSFPTPDEQHLPRGLSGQRGYLVQAVDAYLVSHGVVSEAQLAKGGHRITTTLVKGHQDALVKAVDDKLISKLDKKERKADRNVRAGGVAIDPDTGKVLAMYGGIDYTEQYVNNATRRDYQVGSTFKPFVLTAALQHKARTQDGRAINPNARYDGTNKRRVEGWTGGPYEPENEDERDYGDITLKVATDRSVNAVYAQLAVDVGPEKVKDTAIALGLPKATPDLQPYPSIALGTATASVLDMAEAYATLADHGRHRSHRLVQEISHLGEKLELPQERVQGAVTRRAADTTTEVLRSVVRGGTGMAAREAGRPAAGKTGTAEEDTAAWFAGYTPDLTTVIAVMGQDPKSGAHTPLYGALGLPRINGGGPPAEIWAQFTRAALAGQPVRDFQLDADRSAEDSPTASPSETGAASRGPRDPDASGEPDGDGSSSREPGGDSPSESGGDTEVPPGMEEDPGRNGDPAPPGEPAPDTPAPAPAREPRETLAPLATPDLDPPQAG
ncbi:penicillin-binding protein [Streptomyces albidoflavus]|uniref:transglycosylase domain-containing protein n=1 Tax=Streptomyces albidoflavus TaxID=1886 RepID=UPI00101E5470|nr:transglycosylase domain-containing protein [Streptomyces albidoflavus]RZD66332.1 penicillin-binding protein [Streptomyces albidoflavus]